MLKLKNKVLLLTFLQIFVLTISATSIHKSIVFGLSGLSFLGFYKLGNKIACLRNTKKNSRVGVNMQQNPASSLYSCYYSKFTFPLINTSWTGGYYRYFDIPSFNQTSKLTRVYCTHYEKSNIDKIWQCLLEREPCNFASKSHFDKKKLKHFFGYTKSGYRTLFEKNNTELPPNIAVFCKTPIWKKNIRNQDVYSGIMINLLNLVGFAFDSKDQVDYKYFFKNDVLTFDKKTELLKKMEEVFDKCFYCAIDKNLTRIVLNLFGCAVFAKLYPGGDSKFTSEIYFKALENSLKNWSKKLHKSNVFEISLMGNSQYFNTFKSIINNYNFNAISYGFIPNIFQSGGDLSLKSESEKTLFTNAWNPHSVAGNGNNNGNLDGHWGQISAISVLCDPKINKSLEIKNIIFIKNEK